jgi:vacuolar protein sorting-associated protein 45
VLSHCGAACRTGDLFHNKSWLAATKKSLQRNIKGVQNVYTQHTPYLASMLEQALKGTLSESQYPFLGAEPPPPGTKRRSPTEVLVFIVGGATYEEARFVAEMNTANPGVRVLLGGTTIHNSDSFLAEVHKLASTGASAPSPAAVADSILSGMAGGMAGLGIPSSLTAPTIDSKRIKALTSSVSSTLSSGVSAAMSKIQ